MDAKKLALRCQELADNKKAENLLVLDVRKLSSVTDYFVIVSGTSSPHLRAIVNEITEKLKEEHQLRPRAVDGNVSGDWVVLDYFDVIVHVMRQDVRERYDLESLWGDAPQVKPTSKPAARKKKKTAARKKAAAE
jgi:iojap-like ribosome-associated protein